jgi:hypothetical protein
VIAELSTFNILKYGHFTSKIFTDEDEVKRLNDVPKSIRKKLYKEIISECIADGNKTILPKLISACNDHMEGLISISDFWDIHHEYWEIDTPIIAVALTVIGAALPTRGAGTFWPLKYYQPYLDKFTNCLNQLIQEYDE